MTGGGPVRSTERLGDARLVVEVRDGAVHVDGRPTSATLDRHDERHAVLRVDETRRAVLFPGTATPGVREVVVGGWRVEVEVESERRAALRERASRGQGDAAHGGPVEVRAIIPGVVVSVAVATGDAVEPGERLLVLEAMKMQNELRAPRAGRVARVAVGPGDRVEVGAVLVVIE